MNTEIFARRLLDLLSNTEVGADALGVYDTASFSDVGLTVESEGIVVLLADGTEFLVSIERSVPVVLNRSCSATQVNVNGDNYGSINL